ncbi:Dolichyl-phosphate-mannose--protein mannosyltransferase 4 [Hanseniaspora uvarum DSM 2768]|nr:hypothetical protein FOG50_02223 [Hanseniaspora uvarum]KKA02672.1 Dolichyl-phosphate-mannose--protein mannosyltransferase 4 [Hanseniaspora uvarum DSM 2768]
MAVAKKNDISVSLDKKDKEYNSLYNYLGTKSILFTSSKHDNYLYTLFHYIVIILATLTRALYIHKPSEVIFDEVHFGKFASHYLESEYYFDLHPPMGKICTALIGYMVGYKGGFKFDDIGLEYPSGVPFLLYRLFNCLLGIGICSIIFKILKQLNMKPITCLLGALLVVFDNSHVIESRLILLDAQINFWIVVSIYAFIRFYKIQLDVKKHFSWSWYLWLNLTGVFLSFVISIKYVGVFTFAMVGIAVAFNLWQLLDKDAGVSDKDLLKHFLVRVQALIVCPFLYYLFWFWLHFQILYKSGPGDEFMSPEFQRTLEESSVVKESRDINYFDIVNLKVSDLDCFMYSNSDFRYPLQYEDGRVSSQGQQVSCTTNQYNDDNYWFQIIPIDTGINNNHGVGIGATVKLLHVKTNSFLRSHDVASSLTATNEEVTTLPIDELNDQNIEYTFFRLDFVSGKPIDPNHPQMKTKYNKFKLIHQKTNVALKAHIEPTLPDWGLNHYEINGNKKIEEKMYQVWTFDKIHNLPAYRDFSSALKHEKPKLSFWTKYIELQKKMFASNNALSSEHPFASEPQDWPLTLSGVSYWNKDSERKQIYFIGNIVGWWIQMAFVFVYIALVVIDLIVVRRGYTFVQAKIRDYLYGSLMWLFLGWLCHYFPFFLMNRQRFLHHYLPAHLILCVFTAQFLEVGIMIKFIPSEEDEEEEKIDEYKAKKANLKLHLLSIIIIVAVVWFFYYWKALTYGLETLSVADTKAREWFDIKLQYTKET